MRPLAPLLVALLVLAGCGAGTKATNAYVTAVNRAQATFASSVTRLQSAPSGTPKDARALLQGLRASVQQMRSALQAVEPPARVRGLHRRLIEQLTRYDDSIGRFRSSLSSGSIGRIQQARSTFLQEVSQIAERFSATLAQLSRQLRS
jgi:hypothetical protein